MGVLVDGKYYPDKSPADFKRHVAPLEKQAQIFRQTSEYQKFDRELVQPYLPDGSPNPEFIKHYPRESVEYGFIKDDR